jgi:hypothetical protein
MGGHAMGGHAMGGHAMGSYARGGYAGGGHIARYGGRYRAGPIYGGPVYDSYDGCAGYGYGYRGCPGYALPFVGGLLGGYGPYGRRTCGTPRAAAFLIGSGCRSSAIAHGAGHYEAARRSLWILGDATALHFRLNRLSLVA